MESAEHSASPPRTDTGDPFLFEPVDIPRRSRTAAPGDDHAACGCGYCYCGGGGCHCAMCLAVTPDRRDTP
ncbi:hypothetical protein ACIRD2_31935 [Streptomyces sp. NPDC093595]|jgi:hypothetical protein|uniref:hypothetical protein n=1 Tax=Streptomyces sp. NPDC093595 TaxID=3366045 RepID=UPI0037F58E5E